MQANQSGVMWTVIIAAVVLLIAGFAWNNSNVSGADFDALETRLSNQIAANQGTDAGDQTVTVDTSQFDAKFDEQCSNTDGCGGWWDSESKVRDAASYEVLSELTESDNRDLFREIEDLVDIDEKEDIVSYEIHKTGDVRQNIDTNRDLDEDSIVTVDMVIEVEFHEDGDNDDTKTKYFRIQASLDDLDDGFDGSDVELTAETELVSKHFTLP